MSFFLKFSNFSWRSLENVWKFLRFWKFMETFWFFNALGSFLRHLEPFESFLKILGDFLKFLEFVGGFLKAFGLIWKSLVIFGNCWKLLEVFDFFFFLFQILWLWLKLEPLDYRQLALEISISIAMVIRTKPNKTVALVKHLCQSRLYTQNENEENRKYIYVAYKRRKQAKQINREKKKKPL